MANQNLALAFMGGALLIAVGATFTIYKAIEQAQAENEEVDEREIRTVTVVAASRTLYQGVEIRNDDLFVMSVPPEYLPSVKDPETGTVTRAEVFRTRERVVGQIPRERILKNELIRPERLSDGTVGVGLNALVARGMRALSLDLKNDDAITGFLSPGNYVDVLFTVEDAAGGLHTEALLQSVFVLGVNSAAENEADAVVASRGKQKPSVTFMVTPEQAEQLAFAQEIGSISLALRNVQDVVYNAIPQADVDKVMARVKPTLEPIVTAGVRRTPTKAPQPVAPTAPVSTEGTVDMIKGGTRFRVEAQTLGQIPLKGDGADRGKR